MHWNNDGYYEFDEENAPDVDTDFGFAVTPMLQPNISPLGGNAQTTTKIPPAFDGTRLWFTYVEEVEEWVSITELEVAKQGPALRNRLVGEAAIYKPYLDVAALAAQDGVSYFLKTLRPYYVKSALSVFLWRYNQLSKFHRRDVDFRVWIARYGIARKRCEDAWMDTMDEPSEADGKFQGALRTLPLPPRGRLESLSPLRMPQL